MSKKILHRRGASGNGTIRKKVVNSKGKQYTVWEGRITTGYDPGTGKQIQRSVSGKTQKEVREKLQAIAVEINNGTYREPSKMTLAQWMDIWTSTYLGGVKPRTVEIYKSDIRLYITPALGAVRLESLSTHTIQQFYNQLTAGSESTHGLSAKTVKNIHGVLHHALKQAVANGLLRSNPADACILPRVEKRELKPLDEYEIPKFLKAIEGSPYEDIFLVTLFTGLREGEVLGLTWDCIDFDRGILLINKQIQLHQEKGIAAYTLVSPKSGKSRTVPREWRHLSKAFPPHECPLQKLFCYCKGKTKGKTISVRHRKNPVTIVVTGFSFVLSAKYRCRTRLGPAGWGGAFAPYECFGRRPKPRRRRNSFPPSILKSPGIQKETPACWLVFLFGGDTRI